MYTDCHGLKTWRGRGRKKKPGLPSTRGEPAALEVVGANNRSVEDILCMWYYHVHGQPNHSFPQVFRYLGREKISQLCTIIMPLRTYLCEDFRVVVVRNRLDDSACTFGGIAGLRLARQKNLAVA